MVSISASHSLFPPKEEFENLPETGVQFPDLEFKQRNPLCSREKGSIFGNFCQITFLLSRFCFFHFRAAASNELFKNLTLIFQDFLLLDNSTKSSILLNQLVQCTLVSWSKSKKRRECYSTLSNKQERSSIDIESVKVHLL